MVYKCCVSHIYIHMPVYSRGNLKANISLRLIYVNHFEPLTHTRKPQLTKAYESQHIFSLNNMCLSVIPLIQLRAPIFDIFEVPANCSLNSRGTISWDGCISAGFWSLCGRPWWDTTIPWKTQKMWTYSHLWKNKIYYIIYNHIYIYLQIYYIYIFYIIMYIARSTLLTRY